MTSPVRSTAAHPYAALDMTGKIAVVTGASRGIGLSTARLLAARGATVINLSRSSGPADIRTVTADLGDPDTLRDAAARIREEFPAIHVLVNNAGVGAFDLGIAQAEEADWDRIMGINAKAAFLLTHELLPALERGRPASVVNVSSVHAVATAAGVAPYAASKGALVALTRSMAIDLAGSLVRVVGVLPGATRTEMLAEHADRLGPEAAAAAFPVGDDLIPRTCDPEETAEVIAFLASPAASAVVGSSVYADGGMLSTLGF